jgi:hypothetical protein
VEKTVKLLRSIKSEWIFASFLVVIVISWFLNYLVGSPSFNRNNAISVYSTVIQGMSALLSVALAVVIFRIQSLENRNQSLEQSTLNYIFQTTESIYPKWSSIVEKDIENKSLSNHYFSIIRLKHLHMKGEDLEKLRDDQQKRLEETLAIHTKTNQVIKQTKERVLIAFVFLVSPILISFLLLMVSDAFPIELAFYTVAFVILLSAFGVFSLILTVLESLS